MTQSDEYIYLFGFLTPDDTDKELSQSFTDSVRPEFISFHAGDNIVNKIFTKFDIPHQLHISFFTVNENEINNTEIAFTDIFSLHDQVFTSPIILLKISKSGKYAYSTDTRPAQSSDCSFECFRKQTQRAPTKHTHQQQLSIRALDTTRSVLDAYFDSSSGKKSDPSKPNRQSSTENDSHPKHESPPPRVRQRPRTPTKPPPAGAVGLYNLGNTCYFNSTIQALSHSSLLTYYFFSYDFMKDCQHVKGRPVILSAHYARLMQHIWGYTKYEAIEPDLLCDNFKLCAPQFNNSKQHDAQEFLTVFFDMLVCSTVISLFYIP